jgi:hypothetical protein
MVSVLATSAVDRGFEPISGQTKDYGISICYFSTKHAALRKKSKVLLSRNQNNVSEWDDMSIISLTINLFSLNNNSSLTFKRLEEQFGLPSYFVNALRMV